MGAAEGYKHGARPGINGGDRLDAGNGAGGVHYDLYRQGWIANPYEDLNSLSLRMGRESLVGVPYDLETTGVEGVPS